jgi:hypothetical protein
MDQPTTSRDQPRPWLRLRLFYALWCNATDWEARARLLRVAVTASATTWWRTTRRRLLG